MADMIYCNTCGGANPPGRRLCFSCGAPLTISTSASPQPGTTPFSTGLMPPRTMLKQRYRLLGTVGKGGMGAVYEAEDTELGDRLVAVKEMGQHNLTTPKELAAAAESFKREAHMLAKLHNPHLPSIHDYFTEHGRWYLVMSFIPGETLHHYSLQKGGKLPLDEVLHIAIELCEVLAYLHSQQPPIIFRDLKPSNIMRTPDGQIYLIDFGIARHFKPGQMRDTAIFGSLGYAAPEQYGTSQTSPRSDIYSLGVIMYQLLTGLRPSVSSASLFAFSSFSSLAVIVPPALETLIMDMLEVDENLRPQSMQAIQQELEQIEHAASYAPTIVANRVPVGVAASSALAHQQPSQAVPPPATLPTQQPVSARPQPVLATLMAHAPSRQQWLQQWTKLRQTIFLLLTAIIACFPNRQQWQKLYSHISHLLATLIARVPVRQLRQKLHLTRSQVLATIIGVVLCVLLIIWLDRGHFPTWFSFAAGHVSFRVSLFLLLDMLTLMVALFLAVRSGPLVGLLTGGIGTLLGDCIGTAGISFGWNWDIRVALVGLVTGLLLTQARRRQQPFSRRLINIVSALAILIGTAFASYTDLWLRHEPLASATTIFLIYSIISILVCWSLIAIFFRFFRAHLQQHPPTAGATTP